MYVSQRFVKRSSMAHKHHGNFGKTAAHPVHKPNITFTCIPSRPSFSLPDSHENAAECIALIKDPLWKKVCEEVFNRMGEISVLKIWKSELGESPIQGQDFEIICETEESAKFMKKYDFVIISILNEYFPSLKKLNIKTKNSI